MVKSVIFFTSTLFLYSCATQKGNDTLANTQKNESTYELPEKIYWSDSIEVVCRLTQEKVIQNQKKEYVYCQIKDRFGKVLREEYLTPESKNKIDLSFLPNGVYSFEIYDETHIIWGEKFIQKKSSR